MQESGHVLFPDVIKQDGGRALFYKPCVSREAERVIIDVQFILVIDSVEIVEEEVFYFVLTDDPVGRIGGILIVIVDKYIDRLLIGITESEGVKPGGIAGQYMRRQLDLEEQGRDGVLICEGDKMWCECIYDGVGVGQQFIDRRMGLSFAVRKEEEGEKEKQGPFSYSVFF